MSLTDRQLDVLRGLLNRQSSREIAMSLGVSQYTVKVHIQAIYRYLGITCREHLTTMILEVHGFVRPEKGKAARA